MLEVVIDAGSRHRKQIDRSVEPLLSVRGLKKHFLVRKGAFAPAHSVLKAVDGVRSTSGAARLSGSSESRVAVKRRQGGPWPG